MNLNINNSIENKSAELVRDIVESAGLDLWDVRFEKEGAYKYLRFFIDKEGGVSFDDCEAVNDEINSIIDKQDFIDKIDVLEIGSPGLERTLRRSEHFEKSIGKKVKLRLYKAVYDKKEHRGILDAFDGDVVTINDNDEIKTFNITEISKINLDDLED